MDKFGNRSPPRIPEVQLPEDQFLQIAADLRIEINRTLAMLRNVASGREIRSFLAVGSCY